MRRLFFAVLILLFISSISFAANIDISASVDRSDIEFGDTIQLTISIRKPTESQPMTQNFSNGFSFSFNSMNFSSMDDVDFNIESIPDFDIIGRSQSSKTQIMNGVGESVKQITLRLVPQKIGTLVIPAFSMKDKDGNEHSSKPINVNVKKPAEDPDDEKESTATTSSSNETPTQNSSENSELKKNNDIFKFLLIIGIAIVLVLIAIIAFANYLGAKSREMQNTTNKVEDTEIVNKETKKEEKPVQKEEVEEVVFSSIVASLKVQYKEVNNEFYRKYFEVFKKACCYRNKALSQDMTFDELLNKCSELAGTNNITQATSRLAFDIETVMYANSMPNRQLIKIASDIKEVLNSL